jgi:type IV secretion system protein TrbB
MKLAMIQEAKLGRLKDKLQNELGIAILSFLSNPDIFEIMLNPDGNIWVEHKTLGLYPTSEKMQPVVARQLLGTVADFSGVVVNEKFPILETVLPFTGFRFEGLIPPIVAAPCFSIRKFAELNFTLNDYINKRMLTAKQAYSIREAIGARESILIAGGPGTRKTTLANAVLNKMVLIGNPHQRFLIIEDAPELKCLALNTLFLKTSDYVDHAQLLRATLRFRPDKICLGECRGKEMLTLLKAWNTGTSGGLFHVIKMQSFNYAKETSPSLIKSLPYCG